MRASVDECMRDKKGLIVGRLDIVVTAAPVVVVVDVLLLSRFSIQEMFGTKESLMIERMARM